MKDDTSSVSVHIPLTWAADGTPCITVNNVTRYLRAIAISAYELREARDVGLVEFATVLSVDADMFDCRAVQMLTPNGFTEGGGS